MKIRKLSTIGLIVAITLAPIAALTTHAIESLLSDIAAGESVPPHYAPSSISNAPLVLPAVQSPTDSRWHIETVDSADDVGRYTSLALDVADRSHISYYDETNDVLKYASLASPTMAEEQVGTTWQVEIVGGAGAVGGYPSLALDGTGRPHISYYDSSNYAYKYASRADGHGGLGWQIETVDAVPGEWGFYNSLALNSAGRPHISYRDGTRYDLKYARHDGQDWQIQIVEYIGWGGGDSSLALDGAGQPHISYFDWNNYTLKHAHHDGNDWQIEIVDSVAWKGGDNALALDESDRPHISYVNDGLRYAWYDGSTWQTEIVPLDSLGDGETSMALDKSGRPHIGYSDHTDFALTYAWHNGTRWYTETVPTSGDRVSDISLALDASGQPHISYYDNVNGDLKYAWLALPTFSLSKQATPSDGLRNNDTVTYTLTLSGPSLTVRLWDPLPSVVHYITGSLTGTVTPPAIYSSTAHAVTWEGTLPTDTVSVVRFQVTPGITGAGSLDLSAPIANRAWLTDTKSGLSVSATVIVNGWRVYLPLAMR